MDKNSKAMMREVDAQAESVAAGMRVLFAQLPPNEITDDKSLRFGLTNDGELAVSKLDGTLYWLSPGYVVRQSPDGTHNYFQHGRVYGRRRTDDA